MSITMQPIGGAGMKCFCDWGHGYSIGHQKEQRKPKTRTRDRLRDVVGSSAALDRIDQSCTCAAVISAWRSVLDGTVPYFHSNSMHEEPRHPRPCRDVI